MEQYRNSPRAKFIDYDKGDYFVTICTHNKKHYFGEIKNGTMILSEIGKFVERQLIRCDELCRDLYIPLYVVMPNHIHFIISINGDRIDTNQFEQRTPNPALRANPSCRRHVPALSKYVSSLKGAVSKYAKSTGAEFGWQPRYHDHLIRGHTDGNNIGEYIMNNVAKWQMDCFFDDTNPTTKV